MNAPVRSLGPMKGFMFDGRIAEDFKLASGTWVSVGPLRTSLIAALAPFVQDVVIAGLDRDYLAALLIPDLRECAIHLNLAEVPTFADLRGHALLRKLLRDRLRDYAQAHTASSVPVRRAIMLPTPPSLDHGEITDKRVGQSASSVAPSKRPRRGAVPTQ
jgi:feruloyl-CoA synthase